MEIDVQSVIQTEKLNRMLSQNTRSVLSSAALGFLLLFTQAHQANIPLHYIYSWSVILFIISCVRIAIGRHYLRHPTVTEQQKNHRLNVLRMSIIITSMCWGANAYLAGHQQSIEMLFFCSFIISGISSGAVISYAVDKVSAMAYLLFAITPLLIYHISLNTPVTLVMGIAGALYVVFMYFSINMLNQHLIDNIVLRVEAQHRDMQIKKMAFHDALTGLPNRRLLLDRLTHAINLSKRNQTGGAVMFIDLDNFKKLNDTQGHAMGDLLLQQVAERLKSTMRESDTVARFGGDEFVMLLENLEGNKQEIRRQLKKMTEKILQEINKPYMLSGAPYLVSPSIGVAIIDQHGSNPDDLLKRADAAMYQAKRAGRNTARIYHGKD